MMNSTCSRATETRLPLRAGFFLLPSGSQPASLDARDGIGAAPGVYMRSHTCTSPPPRMYICISDTRIILVHRRGCGCCLRNGIIVGAYRSRRGRILSRVFVNIDTRVCHATSELRCRIQSDISRPLSIFRAEKIGD